MAREPQSYVLGGLYGLLVGDAVGVPYEFHEPSALPPLQDIELIPPPGFNRSHTGAPTGAWSDDGAQALCLLASLLHCDGLNLGDLGRRIVNWYDHGYLAAEGVVFDVGGQTLAAIDAIRAGVPGRIAGPDDEMSNGNGALMRVLPLALWHRGPVETLLRDAMLQSRVTHGHPRSQLCCALYCAWARREMIDPVDSWALATADVREFVRGDRELERELQEKIRPDREPGGGGTGYVVDSLHSARLAALETSYEAIVKRAVSLGNDTDTTAAIAGGIAGIRHGYEAIPSRWLSALSELALVRPLADELAGTLGASPRKVSNREHR
jgi:ADP-ribosylglycohydrolase